MDDAPPVTVPTAVREPFDFGDEPFGDHDAIASVLDDAGRMLGVERDAGRASKAAPSVFDKATRSEYAAPSAAAAAAAQKAVADELEALADGFPAEESLGVQIGTIGRSGAVAAATAAVATDAKAARRADQLKKYGRAAPRGTGASSSSGKNHARLPKSVYAQDLEARDRAKAEREAREAKARAPFITAKYGVKLPAPVSSLQIGEKSAKARARRAALGAAKQAKEMRLRQSNARVSSPGPFAAVPWRVNANVAHDVTDPISVSFNEAKRARAKAELKAKEERAKRDPNGIRGARVDRSKYPSFKAWLDAQAEHDAKLRAQMPGYVDAARAANAKRREAAYMEKVRAASGVPNAPGESKLEPSDVSSRGEDDASMHQSAPALNRFIALTEAFADASSSGKLSLEEQERALMECAAEAAREAVEAAAAAAADASLAEAAEEAATLVGEAAYEDEALLRQVAEVQTPKKNTTAAETTFILGQNPRGSPRSLFGAAETFGPRDDVSADSKPARHPGRALDSPMTEEERLADALSKMTPEERLAARAKASKGWSGDFTGVFYASKTVEGEDAAPAAPTWSEKPVARGDFLERSRAKLSAEDSRGANDDSSVSSDAVAAAKEDKSVSKTDTDSLAVQFIGPNAAELAFRALNPDAPKEATASAKESTETFRYASPGAVAARDAAARAAEGLDPADPACPAQCVARLKEMGIEFFGKQAEVLAFNAVFPDREVPKDATKSRDETDKAKTSGKSSSFDPAIPLAHQTGAAGLAVEFIGANAEELTRRALRGDEDAETRNDEKNFVEKHEEVWSSDREAEEMKSALPSTPEGTPTRDALDAVVDDFVRDDFRDDPDAPLSAAQEEAWSKAAVAVPGTSTSASPAALEANLADVQTAENEVAAAEASAAAARDAAEDDVDLKAETDAAFAEADRAYEHLVIDAGSGAAVPTALVAPLSDDALRDAGTPGGGEA